MSAYFIKGRGWRFDFTHKGIRHTGAWFKTKREAMRAEVLRREEVKNPKEGMETRIDTGFLELVNRRLDFMKVYNSERHYKDYVYLARKWVREWQVLNSHEITTDMVQSYLLKRAKVSPFTANKELRYLRSLFNFAVKKGWIPNNPTQGIPFLPVEKKIKRVPSKEEVLRVILAADTDTQDYLWTIRETMGRMSEVNRLNWGDVNFEERYIIFFTRKKRGGHLTPRKVPMTKKLFEVLSRRHAIRDKGKPWVFWHRYWDRKKKDWVEGPYKDRKLIMKTLCRKARVPYFRFHALRHFGASILDHANVGIGSIQRILGHENRTTTEIYLHSIGEAEREAMSIFEQATEDSHIDSHTKRKRT